MAKWIIGGKVQKPVYFNVPWLTGCATIARTNLVPATRMGTSTFQRCELGTRTTMAVESARRGPGQPEGEQQ